MDFVGSDRDRGGLNLYGFDGAPTDVVDPLGLAGSKHGKPRRTKHVDNRHVDRKKYPNKSEYRKPNQIDKINERTIASPDRVEKQGDRTRYEKDFGREIGTDSETTNVAVVDGKKDKLVTSFPTKNEE